MKVVGKYLLFCPACNQRVELKLETVEFGETFTVYKFICFAGHDVVLKRNKNHDS